MLKDSKQQQLLISIMSNFLYEEFYWYQVFITIECHESNYNRRSKISRNRNYYLNNVKLLNKDCKLWDWSLPGLFYVAT